jgi:glucokinase
VRAPATARDVAELVASGDPVAVAVWCEAVEALADGLLTGIALHDPAVIAIGGGLAEAGELLLAPLRAALLERRTFHQLPQVVRAELGDEAGVYGAALLAWDSYEESR